MQWVLVRVKDDDPDKDIVPYFTMGYIPVPWLIDDAIGSPDQWVPITEERALRLIADIYASGRPVPSVEFGDIGRARVERISLERRG